MRQTDCAMSLIKKPCKRLKFPCNRCGAKIVNAGLQWQVEIPLYKKWYFMDGNLVQNSQASEPISTVTARRYHPFIDPETSKPSPCNFTGPETVESTPLFTQGQTPAEYGVWVQDFEWQRFGGPPTGPDAWNFFQRSHKAVVAFEQAELEEGSGDLITPGRWFITIVILQGAAGTTSGEEAEDHEPYENYALGGGYIEDSLGLFAVAHTVAAYYPPDDFNCVIPAGETQRWHRPVPTLPILNATHTKATLPDGYEWPASWDPDIPRTGPFFQPDMGTLHHYYAPPYIDVRHVPK